MAIPIIGQKQNQMSSQAVLTVTEIGDTMNINLLGAGNALAVLQDMMQKAQKAKQAAAAVAQPPLMRKILPPHS